MKNQNSHTINIMQYEKQGMLQETYSPLQNLIRDGEVGDFTTKNIDYKLTSYLNIDTQLSYDDSINLILNNNESNPRIINTQFRVLGDHTYEYLSRNQGVATNLYSDDNLPLTTDLFLKPQSFPKIDLISVSGGGLLMGGNYVFYLKYCDEDLNETEVISESSIVSVFHGDKPSGVNGILLDERTTKSINLQISNLENAFSKFFLYFTRETSDINGILITKCYKLTEPYDNMFDTCSVTINGYENVQEISQEDLNIKYNYFTGAKTQAIVQNMLFLGNLQSAEKDYSKLQQISYKISTTLRQKKESIGYLNYDYSVNLLDTKTEYYDPKNIYYYLGYWPDEYYQLGVCYILKDGTTTPAFSLYGRFLKLDEKYSSNSNDQTFEPNKLLNTTTLENTGGVFKLDNVEVINHERSSVNPLYFEFTLSKSVLEELKSLDVQGYFFVRTKRIPTSLFQALSLGVDKISGLPMPYLSVLFDDKNKYVIESFITPYNAHNETLNKSEITSRILNNDVSKHIRTLINSEYSALLSLDPIVNYQLRSLLSWNEYILDANYECKLEASNGSRLYNISKHTKLNESIKSKLAFIDENVPSFWLEGKYFSTRAGSAECTNEFSFIGNEEFNDRYIDNIARGIYSPIIGCNNKLIDSTIYTIKINIESEEGWIKSLLNNTSRYYSITNRYKLPDYIDRPNVVEAYRGDCFTNTVTIRLNRNFPDPTFPSNDKFVDVHTWRKNFGGLNNTTKVTAAENGKDDTFSWDNMNLTDLNSVHLGQWITFKCLSSCNLGLRSIDKRNVVAMTRLGSQGGSFYPVSGFNLNSSGKMQESQVLNEGYNITLSRKSYNKWAYIPFENWNFENRIAFSNVASTKMFTNGFRVFQGLAYKDIDKSFGSIVKLFPYGSNLLCIFEHGIAIAPVKEKALLSTQEGMSIHLYGDGVLQEQVSVISPDYGSTWIESLIKTPDAYYGVDTHANKIWKLNNAEGFQCISDFKIQSFLNENLKLDLLDTFYLGVTNVRTHYNNFKGDVIFTFYNNDKSFSLCYNERLKVWTSKYSWMPLISENINNHFYSFNKDVISKYTNIWKQSEKKNGIICPRPFYKNEGEISDIPLTFEGLLKDKVYIRLNKLYIDEKEYISKNKFYPIVHNSNICGMYYYSEIEDFFKEGGSITETFDNFRLTGVPLKAPNKILIVLYLKSDSKVTSDMIPRNVFVYYDGEQLYITHTGNYNWQSIMEDSNDDSEDGTWWCIYKEIKLDRITDDSGKTWGTATITDGWSEVQEYNNQCSIVPSERLLRISNYLDGENVYEEINYEDNSTLNNVYVSREKSVGNSICVSSIPIVITAPTDENGEIDYKDHELYSAYLYYKYNKCYLHVPEILFTFGDIKVELEAICGNDTIETYTMSIGENFTDSMYLYSHSTTSDVTTWYDNLHSFEYEFIVNQPMGYHKIFNNLVIISNNVEPESLEVVIEGDAYEYKEYFENLNYKFPIIELPNNKTYYSKIQYDAVTKENKILMHQDCLNIKDFGRRLGNISYIEGKWYIVLQPIYYTQDENDKKILKTTRLRDKWAKIRIKYSGRNLAIISAIQTLTNISYV